MKIRTSFTIRMALIFAVLFGLMGGLVNNAAAQATETDSAPDCYGEQPTITYIGYDYIVSGTDGDDVIYVEGGWNFVYANGGDDKVCVVGHFNKVDGGDGDDIVSAEGLYNDLSGNEGEDALYADITTNALNSDGDDLCNDDGC